MKTPNDIARSIFDQHRSQAAEVCENEILTMIREAIFADRQQRQLTPGHRGTIKGASNQMIAERSAARLITPVNGRRKATSKDHYSKITETAAPGTQQRLLKIDDPHDLAQAMLRDLRRSGKTFFARWAPAPLRGLHAIDAFKDPSIADGMCRIVSYAIAERYNLLLGIHGLTHVQKYPGSLDKIIARDHVVLALTHTQSSELRTGPFNRSDTPDQWFTEGCSAPELDPVIIDFTLSQFDANAPFPWVGRVSEWNALYGHTG